MQHPRFLSGVEEDEAICVLNNGQWNAEAEQCFYGTGPVVQDGGPDSAGWDPSNFNGGSGGSSGGATKGGSGGSSGGATKGTSALTSPSSGLPGPKSTASKAMIVGAGILGCLAVGAGTYYLVRHSKKKK